ncbi:hypothetical protein ACIF6L_26490 [Kitasatospora sp. NPDC086009]|uniref:recombination directionality factor n=1 Tax=unclassified Kitasatospora TaxID=2633591 RepID=UPI0037C65FD8
MAGLRLWDTDPEAKPKPRASFADDVVGRFRSGRMVVDPDRPSRPPMPESLDEWRVTTGDPVVAARIAALFGGTPAEWATESEDTLEVLTTAPSVGIIIDSASAIQSDMRLYGQFGSELLHHCDGVEFLDDEKKGQPCGCPESFAARKAEAKIGRAPKPNIVTTFKLQEDPDLGRFRFRSGAWDLAATLHEVLEALDQVGGPARAMLTLDPVEFTIKKGPKKGTLVNYTRPVIKVLGAYEAAVPLADAA